MAMRLQPPPRRHAALDGEWFSRAWDQWFEALSRLLHSSAIPWDAIDFSASSHEDIVTAQGGSATERYHLLAAEYAELQRGNNVALAATDIALDDTRRTVLVTASGKTVTLPAATVARLGADWTVALATVGYVTIQPAGADTLILEDMPIVLDEEGASVTLRCATASSWVLV